MKLTTLLFLTLFSMGVQADGKFAFINAKIATGTVATGDRSK